MATKTDCQPFAAIIRKGANACHAKESRSKHPEHDAPRYVVQMCEELTQAIQDAGNKTVTLADVLSLEDTCVGADYHQKFAQGCHHLAHGTAA